MQADSDRMALALDIEPLFQPLAIRRVRLGNRIVMSPMTRQFSPGGVPGPDVAGYYRRRAEGGIGLIITEGTGVDHPAALDSPRIPVLHGDAALAGWRRVVDEVHAAGGLIFPQLWHQGVLRDTRIAERPDIAGLRPSGIFGPIGETTLQPDFLESVAGDTEPMTRAEIDDVVAAYARSARNAVRVGFDGIAIHAGHGYLIDSFLWAGTNRRTDAYGGSPAKRARFAVEVVRAVREAIGPDYPILFRFSQFKAHDYRARVADTPDELRELLTPIAEAGVDVFDGSTRVLDVPAFAGSERNLAGWAKAVTGKLAMTVGSVGLNNSLNEFFKVGTSGAVNNLEKVLTRFNRGEFDLVAVGRAVLGDPSWPKRVRSGESFAPFDRSMLTQLT